MKKLSLFFLSLIMISFLTSIFVFSAKATDYEWIENGSFEVGSGTTGTVENGGFETGVAYPWEQYSGTAYTILTENPAVKYVHTGIHSIRVAYTGSIILNLTKYFGDNVSTSDVTTFNFWGRKTDSSGNGFKMNVYYNDSTTDVNQWTHSNGWYYHDILGTLDAGKFIKWLVFTGYNTYGYLDDFNFVVGEYNPQEATIGSDTTPWKCPFSGNAIIDSTFSRTGESAVHGTLTPIPSTFWNLEFNYPVISQTVGQLNSSTVTEYGLYGYNSGNDMSCGVRGYVWFTDGTIATKYISFSDNETWEYFNFTDVISSKPNKYVLSVGFVQDGTNDYVYFDDVTVISTTERQTWSDWFTFSLTPSPIMYTSGMSEYGFHAYLDTNYVFNGFLSTISEGTFTVYYNSLYKEGETSGVITDYSFKFAITARTGIDFEETFLITLDDGVTTFQVSVLAYWIRPPTTTNTITPEPVTFLTMIVNNWTNIATLFIFAVFTIPLTWKMGVGGFIIGFSISCLIAVWVLVAPVWYIGIMILVDIVALFIGREVSHGKQPISTS